MRSLVCAPRWVSFACVLGLSMAAAACSSPSFEGASPAADAITSNDGTPLELRFSAEVTANAGELPRTAIVAQLQYAQGMLTSAAQSNAQANMPALTNVRETIDGDKKRIAYDASLTVVWQKDLPVPATYEIALPRDVTALDAFNAKYDGKCGRNEYGQETFWHDFDPKASECRLDDADAVRATATVQKHPLTTEGKYPEYDKVWADDALDVVAVYGIISSNTPTDEGARMRDALLAEATSSLRDAARTEAPATYGVIADSTVRGVVEIDGRPKRVSVTGILVYEVSSAGPAFERRYAEATAAADIVIYEGHSGLGKNINALARNMGATAGKYQLVYFYGCQTFAYLGSSMHDKRIALNGAASDPDGTRFLDVIATALPAYGDGGRSTLGLYHAMLDPRAPKTFNDLLGMISPLHLALAFGEHDNTFQP